MYAHGKEWLAPIKPYLYQHHTEGWSRGFLNAVTANAKFFPGAAEVFALHPVTRLTVQGLKKKSDVEAFEKMPAGTLRWLCLSEQRIGPDRVHLLLGERLSNIEWLFLWSNPLGDEGLRALATKSHLNKLRGLSIPSCGVGDEGLEALAASPILANVELLNFDNNQNTSRGILAIAQSPYLKNAKHVRATRREDNFDANALAALRARIKPGFDGKGWEPGIPYP